MVLLEQLLEMFGIDTKLTLSATFIYLVFGIVGLSTFQAATAVSLIFIVLINYDSIKMARIS